MFPTVPAAGVPARGRHRRGFTERSSHKPVPSTAPLTPQPPGPQTRLPISFLDIFINTPGIEESCSSPIPHLSKQRPPLSSCLGQKSFLDALSSHTCAQPPCYASRSCLQNRCGIQGLLPTPHCCSPPVSTPLPAKEHSNAAEPVWTPKSGPGGPAAPATAQGRPGSPAASRAHGGFLHLPGTRHARAAPRLCLVPQIGSGFACSFQVSA